MPSFRRPWGPSRRDTDGVAMNTMEEIGEQEPGKKGALATATSLDSESSDRSSKARKAEHDLIEFRERHDFDPNLPEEELEAIDDAIAHHNKDAELALEHQLEENSPYPEVASAVRAGDYDAPANTFRAWCIGMLFTTIGSGVNMLFSLRNPTIQITSIVAQLLSFPVGLAWARFMPIRKFKTFGKQWSINHDRHFNMKEHAMITIMANVSFGGGAAYSTYTIESLIGFYGVDYGWGFCLLYTITTQMIGFGLAGLFRRFLVYPAAMIWPSVLPNCALFYSLHERTAPDPATTNGWKIPRFRWFSYVAIGSFVWYFFPGWIFQALSTFTFVTWAAPNNVIVNQLFGSTTGLSLLPITFDWTIVTAFLLSPLVAPWHAIANTLIGTVFWFWIVTVAIHYSGIWYAPYLSILSSSSFDNTAKRYNVSRIITSDYVLDEAAYEAYSPLYLSSTFGLTYGLSFATIIAVIIHTYLYHGKEIWYRFKAARNQEDDVHMRLMRKYPEAPDWWFAVIFVIMFGMAMGAVLGYPTHLTWWGFILAIIISFVWFVPIGMIQAITNIQIGLNVFTEFIVGYMLPGRPLAMMSFKTYGYIAMYQGVTFSQDLKLGHYMKVPPRTLFFAQCVASFWSCIVQVTVLRWAFGNIEGICQPDQPNNFTCPNGNVFFTASIIWGLIGPQRMFSGDATYAGLQWFWLVGAILPVVLWYCAKRFPKSPTRFLNAPLLLGATGYIPPATPLNYMSWGLVGFIFNKLIRDRKRGWWSQYNYVTSAALDAGLALSTILIFFALQYTQVNPPAWWGNDVVSSTLDATRTAIQRPLQKGEKFGPGPGMLH